MELDVQYAVEAGSASVLPTAEELERWVAAALAGDDADGQLTIRVVGWDEGVALNETYRHKQGPTNVLSFPFEAPPGVDMELFGDVVICAPVVVSEALEQRKPVHAHWCHLVVHGVLHLLGYDHMEDAEARLMEAREREILQELGYPDPYAAEHGDAAVA